MLADIGSEMNQTLASIFLEPFKKDEYYQFTHETDLDFNEVRTFASNMFVAEEEFLDESKKILEHLYSETTHPILKVAMSGFSLLRAALSMVISRTESGFLKSKTKKSFLKMILTAENFKLAMIKGLPGQI